VGFVGLAIECGVGERTGACSVRTSFGANIAHLVGRDHVYPNDGSFAIVGWLRLVNADAEQFTPS
jgi:hypothetical protein